MADFAKSKALNPREGEEEVEDKEEAHKVARPIGEKG